MGLTMAGRSAGMLLLAALVAPVAAQPSGGLASAGRAVLEALRHAHQRAREKALMEHLVRQGATQGAAPGHQNGDWWPARNVQMRPYMVNFPGYAQTMPAMEAPRPVAVAGQAPAWSPLAMPQPAAAPRAEPLGAGDASNQVMEVLAKDCQAVPPLVLGEWQRSQCHFNGSEAMEALSWAMGSMLRPQGGLQAGATVAAPAAGAMARQHVHRFAERFCFHPECTEGMRTLIEHYTDCYTDAMCAAMGGKLPFELCRPAMRLFFGRAAETELDNVCAMEPGTDTYCPEVISGLMAEHFDCWAQIHQPAQGCTPECTRVWAALAQQYPVCTQAYAEQTARSQNSASNLLLGPMSGTAVSSSLPGLLPSFSGLVRSRHEICSDLDMQGPQGWSGYTFQV